MATSHADSKVHRLALAIYRDGVTAATTTGERWVLGYRPGLDALRGIAVLLVLADHMRFPPAAEWGAVGVTLFFVLSGFLITSLLLHEWRTTGHLDLVAFYRRRALRLLPALLVVCAAVTAVYVTTGHASRVLPEVGGALSYMANWLRIAGVDMGVMSHTWSLAVEEQFYVAWPLVLLLIGRWRLAIPVMLAALVLVATTRAALTVTDVGELRLRTGTDLNADALIGGCALAFFAAGRHVAAPPLVGYAGLAALAVALGAGYANLVESAGMVASMVAGVLLVWYLSTAELAGLPWTPVAAIGKISYGVYLWHAPVLAVMPNASAVTAFSAIVAIAAASYRFVEVPFLRLKNR